MEEWILSIKNVFKKVIKKDFQNRIQNSDKETILKYSAQQFMSVTELKSNLCTTYIKLCKHFGGRDREADTNGCFHLTLIPQSYNLNSSAQLHELIPVCKYARTYLKLQNFTWITRNSIT